MRLIATLWRVLIGGVGVFFASMTASAYTLTLTESGTAVRFSKGDGGQAYFPITGNAVNNASISPLDLYLGIVKSLRRWEAASGSKIRFDYWQGTDGSVYGANSSSDGVSRLYFASNSPSGAELVNPNIVGMTNVWFDPESGEAFESDIVLNDLNFRFSAAAETTSQMSGNSNGQVFIENVITHELGHALGLHHSGSLQSTMLHLVAPDQAHVSCDDILGVRYLYGDSDPSTGVIEGRILDPDGAPAFGVHIQLISQNRGVSVASAITAPDGAYRVQDLEPGNYMVLVEPFFPGAQALNGFYLGSNSNYCGDQPFRRSFVTHDDHLLKEYSVSASAVTPVADYQIRCQPGSGAEVPVGENNEILAVGEEDIAYVDRFVSGNQTKTYELHDISGRLELHALAYSLFSPVAVDIDLFDSAGNIVQTSKSQPLYSSESSFINYDAKITADNLSRGDYRVQVRSQGLPASRYPAANVFLDSVPFFVLAGTTNEAATSGFLPEHAKCRMNEDFEPYLSPAAPPLGDNDTDYGLFGFCGTIDGSQPPPPPGWGGLVGWFLPWLMMLMMARSHRFQLRRLTALATLKV